MKYSTFFFLFKIVINTLKWWFIYILDHQTFSEEKLIGKVTNVQESGILYGVLLIFNALSRYSMWAFLYLRINVLSGPQAKLFIAEYNHQSLNIEKEWNESVDLYKMEIKACSLDFQYKSSNFLTDFLIDSPWCRYNFQLQKCSHWIVHGIDILFNFKSAHIG